MSKPTITDRLRELLLAAGPMTRAELTRHAVNEGLTRARNPAAVIEQRVQRERDLIELPDGRVDSLARRVAGTVQTYRVTPHARLVREICTDDLALLLAVPGLRWVDGSKLFPWSPPWLPLDALPDHSVGDLIGFRVVAGSIVTERIASGALPAGGDREEIVVDELRRADAIARGRYGNWPQPSCDPTRALICLLALDPTIFAEPMAPLTELIERAGLVRRPSRPRDLGYDETTFRSDAYDDLGGHYPPWTDAEWQRDERVVPLRRIPRDGSWSGG